MRPSSIIRLALAEGHAVRVFIWKSHADMYHALRDTIAGDYNGYFDGKAIKMFVYDDGGRIIHAKNVGDIHLVLNHFGAGVFAHELQHFIVFWIDIAGWGDMMGKYWEPIAKLAGDMTNEFWTKFYEKYQETTP